MICLALLTGLAAFLGVRLALRHHRGGWHHRLGRRHCGGYYPREEDDLEAGDGRWGGWHGGGRGVVLRAVLSRIGARPDQEETIRDAVREFEDSARDLRGEGRKTRHEIAEALRKASFDEVAMGELFARHDGLLEGLRKALVGALAKIHEALDERQRQRLADLLAAGPRAFAPLRW